MKLAPVVRSILLEFLKRFSGVKLINLFTKKCVKVIGKSENIRCVHIALCQSEAGSRPLTVEETASDNPILQVRSSEPTLVCTAYKKNRFYLFTRFSFKYWPPWAIFLK